MAPNGVRTGSVRSNQGYIEVALGRSEVKGEVAAVDFVIVVLAALIPIMAASMYYVAGYGTAAATTPAATAGSSQLTENRSATGESGTGDVGGTGDTFVPEQDRSEDTVPIEHPKRQQDTIRLMRLEPQEPTVRIQQPEPQGV